ncbi:copper resistance D family protein [Paraburkholderia humisilvae]|nr:CopD family protein [Paraburkholderia humisilvae]
MGIGYLRLGSLCTLAFTCILSLWFEAAVISGLPFDKAGTVIRTVLTQTHFGVAWSVGFCGTLLACFGGTRNTHSVWWLVTVGMVAYLLSKAATSHAADAGDFTARGVVHVVHLAATALWAGGVIVGVPAVSCWGKSTLDTPVRRATFYTRLSQLATVALGLVIVTGIYDVTQDTQDLTAPLLSVPYGRIMTCKLAFVSLAILLGGYNRLTHLQYLRATASDGGSAYRDAHRKFDRVLAIEAAVMVVILTIAAVLGHTSPSGG